MNVSIDLFGDAYVPRKKCGKCLRYFPLADFRKEIWRGKTRRVSACPACTRTRARLKNVSPKGQARTRRHELREFGLTIEMYDKMLAAQNGCCAICGKPERMINPKNGKVKRLGVDHNHKTGKVRGLLCTIHNSALGLFGDSTELLHAAIAYLEKHST